jgi:hypothetical protein
MGGVPGQISPSAIARDAQTVEGRITGRRCVHERGRCFGAELEAKLLWRELRSAVEDQRRCRSVGPVLCYYWCRKRQVYGFGDGGAAESTGEIMQDLKVLSTRSVHRVALEVIVVNEPVLEWEEFRDRFRRQQ